MLNLLNKMRNMIVLCKIAKYAVQGKQFPVQQVTYMGKSADCLVAFPYGFYANVPPGELGLRLSTQGSADNRVVLPVTTKGRPSDVNGDVAFFNPLNGGYAIWRADGTLDIKTGNEGAKNVNIDGEQVNLGVGGLPIARVGDSVQIVIPSGSSAGTYNGVITSGGDNTSI